MRKIAIGMAFLLVSATLAARADAAGSSHAEYVKKYEGTATWPALEAEPQLRQQDQRALPGARAAGNGQRAP